ncbi:helix-turn-helix domain-containing protein [Runella sp.]|uniref:helix-turn-helix domain-containing protein n=1 Tax=Runella sp. TaxID=1960881 RepID=UPI003D0E8DF0
MITNYKPSDYEVLRRRGFELKQVGWKRKDIALALGLTAGWVSQTLKKHREKGLDGLLARKPTGCPPKLGPEQLSQLAAELNLGAVNHGFPNHIWTRARVNEVIVKKFGWYATAGQLRFNASRVPVEEDWMEFAEDRQKGSPAERSQS